MPRRGTLPVLTSMSVALAFCGAVAAWAAYPPFVAPRVPAVDGRGLGVANGRTAPAPAAAQATNAALETLRALLRRPDLVLSTGPRSASAHFGFSVRFRHRAKRKNWVWDTHAVRDGDRAIVSVYTGPEGKTVPVVIFADGLFVAVDPMFPGRLLAANNAQPNFRITSQGKGMGYTLTVERKADLLFDAAALIESVLAEVKSARPAPDGKAVLVETERYRVAFSPRPEQSDKPCGVQYVEFAQGYRQLQAWVTTPKEAESIAALAPLTEEAVKALGPERRTPNAEDAQLLLTPGQFDVDAHPDYAKAAARLSSLPRRAGYHFVPESGAEKPQRP